MNSKNKIIRPFLWGVISAGLIAGLSVGTVIASKWDTALTGFFGSIGGGKSITSRFTSENDTQEKIDADAEDVSSNIIKEGTVLLKNNNQGLPLSKSSKVSVFGVTSNYWVKTENITSASNNAFTKALEAEGISINTSLRSLYKKNAPTYGQGGSMGSGSSFANWKIDELSYDHYDSVESSYSQYSDAALIILSRGGSEGSDTPMHMDAQGESYEQSYTSLSEEEKDLLSHVTSSFEKVVLIINAPHGLDMEEISTYDIDSIVWTSGTGDAPLTSLAKLLTGDYDFSGRLADTHLMNNRDNTPATQNFGDMRFVNDKNELNGYSYVNYAEGIYVGYKYFETRYADQLLAANNVGEFDYDKQVAYPFGHGLSYNQYDWSDVMFSAPDSENKITASVTVKNSGTLPGKDVVEFYYQAPYTDYDKTKGIEKSAVNLIGFGKTKELQAGESDTVSITFSLDDLASWDETYRHDSYQGAYLLEAGNYYFTAAKDAHEATKNILNKSHSLTDGDSAFAEKYTLSQEKAIVSSSTGATYKNSFEDSKRNDAVYLSRSDWKQVEEGLTYQDGSMDGVSAVMAADGKVFTHTLSEEETDKLVSKGWSTSGNPNEENSYSAITTDQSKQLTLEDMFDKEGKVLPFEDEKWQTLLNQLSLSEMNELFGSGGYQTIAIDSVGKPATKEYDGPAKIYNLFNSSTSYILPTEVLMASTWNSELLSRVGSHFGDQCLIDGIAGWYAPAMNIHRTAFGGRVFEYYSEDPLLSGKLAASEVEAVQKKGVYAYIKHFAMNDQETNRGSNGRYCAFSTEQTIRETYLKPFQIAVEEGGANGVMASMNRIGYRQSVYHYGLLTSLLREEWGFDGIIVTDYISGMSQEDLMAGLAAGLNLELITSTNKLEDSHLSSTGIQFKLRETAHYILYNVAGSLAMNGYDYGFAVYKILLIVAFAFVVLYIALSGYFVIKYSFFRETQQGFLKMAKIDNVIALIAAGVFAAVLIALVIWFFAVALPALQFAFQV